MSGISVIESRSESGFGVDAAIFTSGGIEKSGKMNVEIATLRMG